MSKDRIFRVFNWIVALVLLALVLEGSWRFMSSRPLHAPAAQCRANLMQIDGAKAAWAKDSGKVATDVPTATELFGPSAYIPETPKCSKRGFYSLGAVSDKPRCSVAGHTL